MTNDYQNLNNLAFQSNQAVIKMDCNNCAKQNHISFTTFLRPESYRPCMDDYEVLSAIHRDIEGYNDDFDDVVDYLLDEPDLLDNDDREAVVTIQLMLAEFIERIYKLQRELSRVQKMDENFHLPGDFAYYKNRQARLDSLCKEFEAKVSVLYDFRKTIATASRTTFGKIEMSARDWKKLIEDLKHGVSMVYFD